MNEEIVVNEKKKFPWGALGIFILVFLAVSVYEFIALDAGFSGGEDTGILVVGSIFGILVASLVVMIGLGIQYALVKFPTQWISKEENVYKYDIWSAIFYSSAIGTVMNFMIEQFNYDGTLFFRSLVSVMTTGLFLFFYFSGENKESHIKKAITIVQVIWLVLGIGFSFWANSFLTDLLV